MLHKFTQPISFNSYSRDFDDYDALNASTKSRDDLEKQDVDSPRTSQNNSVDVEIELE